MYESFYGFKVKPFQIIPDPDFLYLSPKKEEESNVLIKKSYGIVKQRLDRIEVKIDILREDIIKIRSNSIVAENRQADYLSVEIEKIRSDFEMIKRSEKQSAHMDREEEGKSLNSDSDSTEKNESKDIQGKIYQLDK